jgi:hypothetical protein
VCQSVPNLVTKTVKALFTLSFLLMLMTIPLSNVSGQCAGPSNHCPSGGCNPGEKICVENVTDCEMDINLTNGHCHSSQTVHIPGHTGPTCFNYDCIQCDDGCYCANSIDLMWPSTSVSIPGQAWPVGVYDFPNSNISPLVYCSSCLNGIRIVVSYNVITKETLYSVQCLP